MQACSERSDTSHEKSDAPPPPSVVRNHTYNRTRCRIAGFFGALHVAKLSRMNYYVDLNCLRRKMENFSNWHRTLEAPFQTQGPHFVLPVSLIGDALTNLGCQCVPLIVIGTSICSPSPRARFCVVIWLALVYSGWSFRAHHRFDCY
jgi:hypothetical protein